MENGRIFKRAGDVLSIEDLIRSNIFEYYYYYSSSIVGILLVQTTTE